MCGKVSHTEHTQNHGSELWLENLAYKAIY